MYRFLTALFVAFCAVCFMSLARADECTNKDAFTTMVKAKFPNAIATDLNGEHEKMMLAGLSRMSGKDVLSFDLVLFRRPGVPVTLIMLFENGCASLSSEMPNERVRDLMGPSA